jgi:hypothetical protein
MTRALKMAMQFAAPEPAEPSTPLADIERLADRLRLEWRHLPESWGDAAMKVLRSWPALAARSEAPAAPPDTPTVK